MYQYQFDKPTQWCSFFLPSSSYFAVSLFSSGHRGPSARPHPVALLENTSECLSSARLCLTVLTNTKVIKTRFNCSIHKFTISPDFSYIFPYLIRTLIGLQTISNNKSTVAGNCSKSLPYTPSRKNYLN